MQSFTSYSEYNVPFNCFFCLFTGPGGGHYTDSPLEGNHIMQRHSQRTYTKHMEWATQTTPLFVSAFKIWAYKRTSDDHP